MASVLQQISTLFVLAFAVYFVNGLSQADELRRYSSEDHSIEDHSIEDDWIYIKPATSTSKPGEGQRPPKVPIVIERDPSVTIENPTKPLPSPFPIYLAPSNDGLPPYWPPYYDDSRETIIVVDGHKPSHKPANIGLPLLPPAEGPSKPATIGLPPAVPAEGPSKPLPVPIYVVPSNDGVPPFRPPYTDDSRETIIVVDGHKPSHKPATIGLPPSPPVEGPSKPLPVPIYVVPSNDGVPPFRPPYTDDSRETIIDVDGNKPSNKPATVGLPPAPPVEGPSKPLPVPIYVVPSNDGVPPFRPPYTDDSRETIIVVDGHKPSHKPVTSETHPVPTGQSKPLPSPVPIHPVPLICGRKNYCYQWFDDKSQLSSDGYELCDARDEIYARRFCCVR